MKYLIIFGLFVITISKSVGQIKDCASLHLGKFKIISENGNVGFITRYSNTQIEEDTSLNIKIEYNIKWTSTCSYELTLKKILRITDTSLIEPINKQGTVYVTIKNINPDYYIAQTHSSNFSQIFNYKVIAENIRYKNISSGFYFLSQNDKGIKMEDATTKIIYLLNPSPIVSTKDIIGFKLERITLNDGRIDTEIMVQLDSIGTQRLKIILNKSDNSKIAIVFGNRLLYVVENREKIVTSLFDISLIDYSELEIQDIKNKTQAELKMNLKRHTP